MTNKSIAHMKTGESGIIVEIKGGIELSHKLQAMGLRVGKKIKKTSGHLWRGPQTVSVGSTAIAIGHGMAEKIFVEVKK